MQKPFSRLHYVNLCGRVDFLNATLEDKKRGAKRIAGAVQKLAEDYSIPVVFYCLPMGFRIQMWGVGRN